MKIEVTAFPRSLQGTGASRRLRVSGRVPGIIYGADQPATSVELDQNALLRHLKLEAFHASILDMTVEGKRERVLLRDFQMHPWKPLALHVDFQRVDPKKKIHMRVPLHFSNAEISEGVKTQGGVVTHSMNEIEIQCLPDQLPEFIGVDLKDMKLNDILHVNDLQLPEGVEPIPKLKTDNPSVVSVHVPRVVVAEDEAAAPVTEITAQTPADAAAAAASASGSQKGDKK
ncbi:MAG: ribosomal rRNA E-loop binding protein Ctc/L25/TL5 [Betaproteobacteria bacterium]|jgi:large subunit ribosomal protein L25|nr:ribosomal rRNA E-loop binding protein Ctc/L25/TL5 [Betaproteobacteria bacterium]